MGKNVGDHSAMKTENQIHKMIRHLKDAQVSPLGDEPEFSARQCTVFCRLGLEWACDQDDGKFEQLFQALQMVDNSN